jgi:hypothetical protein
MLLSCGSSGPSDDLSAYAGTWTLAVEAAPGCWPALAIGFTVDAGDIEAHDVGGSVNLSDDWWLTTEPGTRRTYNGFVTVGREFRFVYLTSAGNLAFDGGVPSPERLTGTFTDPDGVIAGAGCSASAVAEK